MKRRFTFVTIALAGALTLVGCSATTDEDAAIETPVEETTAAEAESNEDENEESSGGHSTAEGCVELADPLSEAAGAMAEIAESPTDPQSAVDSWRTLSDGFDEAGKSVSNPEVSQLATIIGEKGHVLTDEIHTVFVDQDMSQMERFTEAQDDFFESYEELLELCSTGS